MTEPSGRLFLVDGSALAYRSHFAFVRNPLVTRSGKLVSAAFGFSTAILRLLKMQGPTHLAVVFDAPGPTFRHEQYAEYKATRQKMPEELVEQLPDLDTVLEALAVPVLRLEGYEADDVIGTLARQASSEGFDVRIVSGDKDFMQLVDERIQLFQLGKGDDAGEDQGADHVRAKFGVEPEQIVDLLSLMGDSSDNVPGVPKVGPKTASTLLQTFGSLDSLYERLDEVSRPALRKTLEEHRDSAFLSRSLVTLVTDLSLEFSLKDFERRTFDPEPARALFQELEFKTLLSQLPAPGAHDQPEEVHYAAVTTPEALATLVESLRTAGTFAIDTETTGLDPRRAELVGISVSTEPGTAWYVPVRVHTGGLFGAESEGLPLEVVQSHLSPLLADASIAKVGQNLKYDLHILERHAMPVHGVTFDSMIAHYCLAPSAQSHSLDTLALELFDHVKIPTSALIGRGKKQITMADVPLDQLTQYACEDADYTLRVVRHLEQELRAKHVDELFQTLELPLIDVLRRMEAAGFYVDAAVLKSLGTELAARCATLEESIHELAGEPFNVNSPKQLAEILYDKLDVPGSVGLKRVAKTKTGLSTSAAALAPMAEHPLVGKILEYRQLEKLRSTYIDTLPTLVHPQTGRVHTSFNQAVAATGRLSSSDPNLQNIPIRTEAGRAIRKAFRSSFDGGSLIAADYSQVELRILAHLSRDEQLGQAFANQLDVHRHTASLVFHVEPEEVDSSMRTRAKAINFGIIYGMGAQRLARETGLTFKEAQEFIQRYFEVFAGVKAYLDQTIERAQHDGYVTTLLGRRRYIPELLSSEKRVQANARNVAVNTPIQGTAADLIKKAMIDVDRTLTDEGVTSRMILQVHDELVFDVAPGESETIKRIAREGMEGALALSVPLVVDVGEGKDWLEAH